MATASKHVKDYRRARLEDGTEIEEVVWTDDGDPDTWQYHRYVHRPHPLESIVIDVEV